MAYQSPGSGEKHMLPGGPPIGSFGYQGAAGSPRIDGYCCTVLCKLPPA